MSKQNLLKNLARSVLHTAQAATTSGKSQAAPKLIIAMAERDGAHLTELRRRFDFFMPRLPWDDVQLTNEVNWKWCKPETTILRFGIDAPPDLLARVHGGIFDIDWRTNPLDGWHWIDAASRVQNHVVDLTRASQSYRAFKADVADRAAVGTTIFGTGPSLELARQRTWREGVRIVCNTIVRDADLWHHIDPDMVVAGDGIYHFGFTAFAEAFRSDLIARLNESARTKFLYPAQFDIVVRRSMPNDLHTRLVPVPVGTGLDIHTSLKRLELPALGNVLNLLLLPVACDISRQVSLWGFDGRAPTDQLFWSNSAKQSYAELLPGLQAAHPAFFDHNVPKDDPEKYLRSVYGDVLENCLRQAEAEGWTFRMLHKSWTKSLADRSVE